MDLSGLPTTAPARPASRLRYADVAVTPTAKEFAGIYRGKPQHPPDFPHVLDRARAAGVSKVLLTGMSLADVSPNLAIARSRAPGSCYVTIGVHPYHAGEAAAGGAAYLDALRDALRSNVPGGLVRAFGELGLDYERAGLASKEDQMRVFRAQLDMHASEGGWGDLPLFLHCRGAFGDFVEVMAEYAGGEGGKKRGLVHSFVGTRAQMERLLELGLDVGVNGFSFRDRESLDMVAAVPLDRLQLETDAPWGEIKGSSEIARRYLVNAPPLPPSKKRDRWDAACMVKERNESCAIERVAYIVAGLKEISVQEVAEAAWKNSVEMFGLGEM
ncbi:TatD family hydrolase [Camillea tinctor]|nr:TatD family hydrolase [Camillea tinctor]